MHLFALLALVAVVSGACAESVGTPPFQQVKQPGTAVFNCKFDRPITDCRVRVSENWNKLFNSAVLDFGLGLRSASVGLKTQGRTLLATASYAGSGLAEGHCGLQLRVAKTWYVLVVLAECLGRAEDGGWMQGHGLVTSYALWNIISPTVLIPRLVVAAPGSDVAVLLTAQGPLEECYIKTPAAGQVEVSPSRSLPSSSRYRPHGAGIGHGQCGFTLSNVTQQDEGVWTWRGSRSVSIAFQATVVLLLEAPVGDPMLVVPDAASMRVGDLLNATCRAPPSVPPANLAWFLGDAEVRRDSWNDTLPGDVGGTLWQPQAFVQTLTRRLTATDLGKRLECRMQHQGLRDVRSVGQVLLEGVRINVSAESAVIRSAVGHRTQLACIVDAWPAATVQWSRAGVSVVESPLVVTGNDDTRHWLLLEDTATEDLTDFTCTASYKGVSASDVVTLTGLPGTPQWSGSASQLAWLVESVAPLTVCLLKTRLGTGPWQERDVVGDARTLNASSVLVQHDFQDARNGNFSAFLIVRNQYGPSPPSSIHYFSLDVNP